MTDAEFDRWKRMVNRAGLHVGPDKRVPDAPKPAQVGPRGERESQSPVVARVVTFDPPVVKSAPPPAPGKRWAVQCKAVDRDTGLRCRLLDPHPHNHHAHERGAFLRLLEPGATPDRVRVLDSFAGVRNRSPMAEN